MCEGKEHGIKFGIEYSGKKVGNGGGVGWGEKENFGSEGVGFRNVFP